MFTDLPEEDLRAYRSDQTDPDDFDDFWADTLAASRRHDLAVTATLVETPLTTLDVYDVSFAGFDGQPVKAWLRTPVGASGPLPTIVQYHGYGGGRGQAIGNLLWASAGFAHFEMDTRGQGWGGNTADTADEGEAARRHPGF